MPSIAGVQRRVYVHRLVAQAFLGPCPDGHEVHHHNATKTDNQVGNLAYVTRKQNVRFAQLMGLTDRKLTPAALQEIAKLRRAGHSIKKLATWYGVSPTAIYRRFRLASMKEPSR